MDFFPPSRFHSIFHRSSAKGSEVVTTFSFRSGVSRKKFPFLLFPQPDAGVFRFS